jgi:hypothetical protein
MEYTSNDNKGLLWGILQESNIFDGINNTDFNKIQNIFESTIHDINLKNQNKILMDKNKITIEEMITKINKEKKKYDKPKIKMVYKSEDLKQERLTEFNNKLHTYTKENEDLNIVKKPDDITFIDDNEDKPIGNEIDKLISERLANRERELDLLPVSTDAEQWINNGREITTSKKVTFKEDNIKLSNSESNKDNNNNNNNNNDMPNQVNNILNLLKKKTSEVENKIIPSINDSYTNMETDIETNTNTNTNSNISLCKNEYDNLLKEIKNVKVQQENIISMCTKIMELIQYNK